MLLMNVVDPAVLSVSTSLSPSRPPLRPALTPSPANPTDPEPGHAESGASTASAPADVPPTTRRIPLCARPGSTAASAAAAAAAATATTVVPSACNPATSHAALCARAARPAAASARAGRIRGHAATAAVARRDAAVPANVDADAAAGTWLHPRVVCARGVGTAAAAERCRAWNAGWEPAGDRCGPEHGVRGSTCASIVPFLLKGSWYLVLIARGGIFFFFFSNSKC